MKIEIDYKGDPGVCVVNVQGDIDSYTVPDLEAVLQSAISRGCVNFVIDLEKVSYADSSALGVIVWMNRILEPQNGRLVLAAATRNVTRILELSGLVGAAPTVSEASDIGDALAGLMLPESSEPPLWTRQVDVAAEPSSLARIRSEVCAILEPLHMPESTLFDIRVAVGEALSNAIRHGSPCGESDQVSISVAAHEDRVVLVVSDCGHGFDGEASREGDPYAPSGRGIMFMRALMDHVEFNNLPEGGTAVTLVKHLGEAVKATPSGLKR
ncbi:MAG: anti-sigma factor antagonist [Coriobacteriia bacterium]|nr:anti-sigma factor antagonist [Coriobacteriia bacterium]